MDTNRSRGYRRFRQSRPNEPNIFQKAPGENRGINPGNAPRRYAPGMTRIHASVALALALALAAPARAEVAVLVGDPAGRVTKEPNPARVNEPFAVAFDAEERMYGVEYTRGNRLFRVAADGTVEFVAGRFHVSNSRDSFPPDEATAAADVRFHGLHDVAIDAAGAVYVADTFNHRIRTYDPATRSVAVLAGTGEAGFSGDGGPARAATFKQAYCGSLEPAGDALLVADIGNHRLRRVSLRDGTVETVVGSGKAGKPVDGVAPLDTPLAGPRAACMAADGTIYLALREGNALVEIKANAVRTVVNATGKSGYGGDEGPGREALLAGPKYVALDRAGRVLIADTENHCIRRYDPERETITTVAGVPRKAGAAIGADLRSTQLVRPHGCMIAPDGRLVIADSDNDRIVAGPAAE
jgi:sugar lactone lactonase YvrE